MNRFTPLLVGFSLFGLVAAPGSAAVLPVTGIASVSFLGLPAITFTGSGSGSSIGGGIASHPALVLSGGASLAVAPTFLGIGLITLQAGNSLPAGVGAGANGIAGTANLFAPGGTPAGAVPLSPVGGGGTGMLSIGPTPAFVGTLNGATWQAAAGIATPVVFSTATAFLAVPFTVTATAYDNRTANGVGTVQFVAPAITAQGFGMFPVYGQLTLTYTPEPGTVLLLGSGVAWLAALGRRKQHGE